MHDDPFTHPRSSVIPSLTTSCPHVTPTYVFLLISPVSLARLATQQRLRGGSGTGGGAVARPQAPESVSGRFAMTDCAYAVQESKVGTARIVCWAEFGIANSYTLEASFCGAGNNMLIDARCGDGRGWCEDWAAAVTVFL